MRPAAGQGDFGVAGGSSGRRQSGGRGAAPLTAPLVCGRAPRAMATAPPRLAAGPPRGAVRTSPPTGGDTHRRARTHRRAHLGHPRASWGRPVCWSLSLPLHPEEAYGRVPQVLQSEPLGAGVYLRRFSLCPGVSLSAPVSAVLEGICLSVLMFVPPHSWMCSCPLSLCLYKVCVSACMPMALGFLWMNAPGVPVPGQAFLSVCACTRSLGICM